VEVESIKKGGGTSCGENRRGEQRVHSWALWSDRLVVLRATLSRVLSQDTLWFIGLVLLWRRLEAFSERKVSSRSGHG
jgi:hypothetical protein